MVPFTELPAMGTTSFFFLEAESSVESAGFLSLLLFVSDASSLPFLSSGNLNDFESVPFVYLPLSSLSFSVLFAYFSLLSIGFSSVLFFSTVLGLASSPGFNSVGSFVSSLGLVSVMVFEPLSSSLGVLVLSSPVFPLLLSIPTFDLSPGMGSVSYPFSSCFTILPWFIMTSALKTIIINIVNHIKRYPLTGLPLYWSATCTGFLSTSNILLP